jgi:hypothetical protein
MSESLDRTEASDAPALQPLTAREYVQTLRDLGNRVGFGPDGSVSISSEQGVKLPDGDSDFHSRLRLWREACKARGAHYVDEVADFLDAELDSIIPGPK